MTDIETLANDLLARAEFCGGFISNPEYETGVLTIVNAISEICGKHTLWFNDENDFAQWECLLTREVILSGGL